MDDVLFQHQIGNIGVGTVSVLRYILDHQLTKGGSLFAISIVDLNINGKTRICYLLISVQ